jgi:hypothetical protein
MLVVAVVLAVQSGSPVVRFEADGFWLNLHHFLYVLGRAQNHAPDAQRRAVVNAPVDHADGPARMGERERLQWESAVRFYAGGWSREDAVFDRDLVAVTNAMRVPPGTTAEALKIEPALRAALLGASAIYRAVWWPTHQAANRARAREWSRLVEQHGGHVRAYITRAYEQAWPKDGFLINVSAYTNWAGAYSTDGGLIVISSLDEGTRGSLGLESIFHEAMHQWDEAMMARLSRLSNEHQTPRPRDGITHALIWYTAAAAVKTVIPNHVGYAEREGMWRQKQLGAFKGALDAYWKPHLEGKMTIDEALVGLLR